MNKRPFVPLGIGIALVSIIATMVVSLAVQGFAAPSTSSKTALGPCPAPAVYQQSDGGVVVQLACTVYPTMRPNPTWSTSPSPTHSAPPSHYPTTSPKPTPTATETKPSSHGPNCINQPSACGYPDSSNSGVPDDVRLSDYTGPMNVTTAGTVIDGKLIHGQIQISAPNVTIKNSMVISQSGADCGTASCAAILFLNAATGGSVTDSTVKGNGGKCTVGVEIRGLGPVIGNDISGCGDGVRGSTMLKDNYIHDFWTSGRANGVCVDTPHNDGLQQIGLGNWTATHNTVILNEATGQCPGAGPDGAFFSNPIDNDPPESNLTITDNLIKFPSFMIRLSRGASNIKISGNRLYGDGQYNGDGGYLLPYTATYSWSDNVRDETGALIPDPK